MRDDIGKLTDIFEREYNMYRGVNNREARERAIAAVLRELGINPESARRSAESGDN